MSERLLGGDWSVLTKGHEQNDLRPLRLRTFGSVFYAIMASFMWVSKDIRWLYFVIDVLAFLSVLPARRFFQVFFPAREVDVLCALWVANTARIVFSNYGLHPALTQFSIALWQLVELGFLLKPSWRRAAAVIAIGLLNVSLHLSTLAAIVALPVLWLLYRETAYRRWVVRSAALLSVATCGIVLFWLWRRFSWSFIMAAISGIGLTFDNLLGFDTSTIGHDGVDGVVYSGPLPALVRWAIVFLVLAGTVAMLTKHSAERNGRILRLWCAVHGAIFLSYYAFHALQSLRGLPGDALVPINRYTNWFYLTGLILLFTGVRSLAGWLRLRADAAVGACYVLAGLHLTTVGLFRLRHQSAFVAVGPHAREDCQYSLTVRALEKWSIPTGWLFFSVQAAGAVPTEPLMPFYADWLTRTHQHGDESVGLRPDTRLVIVRANSPEERVAQASAVDVVEAGDLRGYLEPYDAETASYGTAFLQEETKAFDPSPLANRVDLGFLYTKHAPSGKVSGYIARSVPPADAFAELAYEMVMDGTEHVTVATYIELPQWANELRLSQDNDRLLASSLRLLARDATPLAEIPYPNVLRGEPAGVYATRALVRERFEHFGIADVGDIEIELKYHDPSHYPEPRLFRWSVMKAASWSPSMPRIEHPQRGIAG
jgi:hypothetical protein